MWQAIGIISALALFVFFGFLVHGSWVEKQADSDDALIRAVNSYQPDFPNTSRHASDDAGILRGVVVLSEIGGHPRPAPRPVPPEPMPAVFHGGRKPFMHGGNAHQRAVARRWLVTQ